MALTSTYTINDQNFYDYMLHMIELEPIHQLKHRIAHPVGDRSARHTWKPVQQRVTEDLARIG